MIARGSQVSAESLEPDDISIVFEIADELDCLDQAKWLHPIVIFIKTYFVVGRFVPKDDPLASVVEILRGYRLRKAPVRSGRIADDLSSLSTTRYQAGWFTNQSTHLVELWDPLSQPLADFISGPRPDQEWMIWTADTPVPDTESVRRNLLANYVRVNGFS